jgi:hypothetical protein
MRWMSRTFFAIASKSLQPAIRHLLDRPNQRALDNVARMTAEARRRNLQPAHWLGMVIEALHRPELQHSGFPPLR